jgi:hypothetical protein
VTASGGRCAPSPLFANSRNGTTPNMVSSEIGDVDPVDDPAGLQAICDGLGPAQIQILLRSLANPTAAAINSVHHGNGYRWELSIR